MTEGVVTTPTVRERFSREEIVAALEQHWTTGPMFSENGRETSFYVVEGAPPRVLAVTCEDGLTIITTARELRTDPPREQGWWAGLGAGDRLLVAAAGVVAVAYLAIALVMLWGPLEDVWGTLLSLGGR